MPMSMPGLTNAGSKENEMASHKSIFVTVGTTKFESLIKKITTPEALAALEQLGYTHVSLQIGNGDFEPVEATKKSIPKVSYFRLKDSISEEINSADLVISHAGAGSILDCLDAGKNLLVVINDELMNNHQVELASQLAKEGYLHFCYLSDVVTSLSNLTWDSISPFPPGKPEKFAAYLEKCLGYTDS